MSMNTYANILGRIERKQPNAHSMPGLELNSTREMKFKADRPLSPTAA